jgi:hypothetical protein
MYPHGNYLMPPGSSTIDKWSFYTLLLYFAIQPFNNSLDLIPLVGSYLDLLWSVALMALASIYATNRNARPVGSFELKIVLILVAYLAFCYVVADKDISPELGSASRAEYNLRYLIQSVPVFILVAMRGLNRKELNAILTTIVLMTPFSIFTAYRDLQITSISGVQNFANSGEGIHYNSYVPYTTFPLFAAVYLLSEVKSKLLRIPIACSFALIAVFIFINPSRQSVVFVFLGALIVVALTRSIKKLLLIATIAAIVAFSVEKLDLTSRVESRFFSEQLLETTRTDLMAEGLDTIKGPLDWLFGMGLDLDLDDGVNPHNNYIFSVMRTGLLGMGLMFFPFVRALGKLTIEFIKYGKQAWFDSNFASFTIITVLFVLFHSSFGYPHLDQINAPIVWFGLAVWVVYQREMLSRLKMSVNISN